MISCIIPTYNRAAWLKGAMESILRQTYPHWELLIVDDQSEDNTRAVVESFQQNDPRVRYLLNPRKGQSPARNHGLKHAKGEYIAFLDDDDVSFPHRFESQMGAIKESGCNFLVSGYQVRDRQSQKILSEHKLDLKAAGASFPSRWMIRKSLLDRVGGFDEDFPSMTDAEVSYKINEIEAFTLHDDIVTIIYHTPGSVSRVTPNAVKGKCMMVEKNEKRMHPLETAWWYYVAGIDYYALGQIRESGNCFHEAAKRDYRGIFGFAYTYFKLSRFLKGPFRRANLKILNSLASFRLPTLVNHRVV